MPWATTGMYSSGEQLGNSMAGMSLAKHRIHRRGVGQILKWSNGGGFQGAQAPSGAHERLLALQDGHAAFHKQLPAEFG